MLIKHNECTECTSAYVIYKWYLGAAICIISTAQQAKPKVKGQREHFRPQFTRSSTLAKAQSAGSFLGSFWNGEYLPSMFWLPPTIVSNWFDCKDRGSLSQLIESNKYVALIWRNFSKVGCHNLKCVFQQNNLINTLIWRIFWKLVEKIVKTQWFCWKCILYYKAELL